MPLSDTPGDRLAALAKRADEIAANPPSNDAQHIDWQSGYQDGAMAVAAEIDEFIAAEAIATLSRATEAEPVAWLRPESLERISTGERGGYNTQVSNVEFVGGGFTVPLFATPPAPQPALALIEELERALKKSAEGWTNAIELGLIPRQHVTSATILRDEAWSAIASAKRFKEGE